RSAAGLWSGLPAPQADADLPAHPDAGLAVRDVVWPAGALSGLHRPRQQCGAFRPSGRHGRRPGADPLLARTAPPGFQALTTRLRPPSLARYIALSARSKASSSASSGRNWVMPHEMVTHTGLPRK